MNPSRPDVVFDCNVFLQAAARTNGPAAQALRLVDQNAVTLYISRETLRELRKALSYVEVREKNPALTEPVVNAFLTRIVFRATLVRRVPRLFTLLRDPDDEPYIDLCIATAADYLVTRDKDLLSLVSGHTAEAKQLHQRLPNFKILTPLEFIGDIRARRATEP